MKMEFSNGDIVRIVELTKGLTYEVPKDVGWFGRLVSDFMLWLRNRRLRRWRDRTWTELNEMLANNLRRSQESPWWKDVE